MKIRWVIVLRTMASCLRSLSCSYRCFGTRVSLSLMISMALAASLFVPGIAEAWNYRMKIALPGYQRTENLTNFPVLVVFSNGMGGGFHYSQMLSGTNADLLFMNSNGVLQLNHEIESWNTNGASCAWVQVPSVPNTNAHIWAYWGQSGQTAPPCRTSGATWSQAYLGVWHLSAPAVMDSTSNRYHGAASNNTNAPGMIAGGQGFNGTSAYVGLGAGINPLQGRTAFSISWWMSETGHMEGAQISSDLGSGVNRFIIQDNASAGNYIYANGKVFPTDPFLNNGNWHRYDLTVANPAGGMWRLYRNGLQINSNLYTFTMSTQELQFGKHTTYFFRGGLDELRISSLARSSNWVWAGYQNVASNHLFNAARPLEIAADHALAVLGVNHAVLENDAAAGSAVGTDFGAFVAGRALTNTLFITNTCAVSFNLSSWTTNGASAARFVVHGLPDTVSPGTCSNFSIVFSPAVPGVHTAILVIANNTTNSPYRINLCGTGITAGAIGAAPTSLAFTATYLAADPAAQLVTMTNAGQAAFGYSNRIAYGANASGWLSILDPTGVVAGATSRIHTAGVATAGLNAGTYLATNQVTAPDATNSPQKITVALTVNKAGQTISFPAIPGQEATNRLGLAATSSAGLAVSFAVLGGPGSLADATNLSFYGAGTVILRASQAGNSNWLAAADVTNLVTVTRAPAGVYLQGLAQTYDGTARTVTATTMPAGLTVSITYNGGGSAPVSAGNYAVTGTVVDALYAGAMTGTLAVAQAAQTITFPAPGAQVATNRLGLAASASSGLSVSFAVLSGPASLSAGTNLLFTGAGAVSLKASQPGNANWGPAPDVTNTFSVTQAGASVFFSGLSQSYDGTARAVTATTMPAGLTVSLSYDSLAWPPTNAGTYTVTGTVAEALYAGEGVTNLVVAPGTQTITFPAVADQYLTNQVALGAGAGSGLAVSFAVTEGPGAIADLTNLTFSSTGFVSVAASQAGDANWDAAPAMTNRFFVHNVVIWIRGTNGALLVNEAPAALAAGTDFGAVGVGRTQTNWFRLGNNGTTNLVVSGSTTNGTGAESFEMVGLTNNVLAGTYANFAMAFRPSGLGPCTALVEIAHNGTTNVPYLINVQGTGVEPAALGTSTARLDYATAYGVAPPAAALVLTNLGAAALQFTNIVRQGAGTWLSVAPAAGWLAGNTATTVTGQVSAAGLDAGSYAGTVTVWSAEATNSPLDITVGLQVTQAVAAVTLGALDQAYDGTARAITVGTTPTGLTVVVTYNGLGWAPTNAGPYAVTAMVTEVNYAGQAVDTLLVRQQTAEVNLGDLLQTYDGSAKSASAVTDPAGLTVALTYNGHAATPTNAGSYVVTGTVVEVNYSGVAVDTLVISPADAAVYLESLQQVYDGTARAATATTMPAGLTVSFTYNGSASAPVNAGAYAVTGTVADANYSGKALGILDLARADQAITNFSIPGPQSATNLLRLAAQASSGLAVSFVVDDGPASITDGTNLSFSGAGQVEVAASQAGTSNWNPAADVCHTFTVSRARAAVYLANLAQMYNGAARAATATTMPAGLTVSLTYDDLEWPPTNAGVYAVTGLVVEALYEGWTNGTLAVAKAPQAIDFPSPGAQLATNQLGLAASATSGLEVAFSVTAGPGFLADATNLTFTGTGMVTLVAGQAGDGNWETAPEVTNTFNVTKADAAVYFEDLNQVYDGTARAVTATTMPAGLTVSLTYDDLEWPPTNPGSYAVAATIIEDLYAGGSTGILVVAKAAAEVFLQGLAQTYDGTARNVTATTMPAGLTVSITYNGGGSAPVGAGNYAVTGTVVDAVYAGAMTGTLAVAQAAQTITFPSPGAQVATNRLGLAASAGSGLAVSFAVHAGPASLSAGTNLLFTGAGTVSLKASQPGNANWDAAPDITNTISVTKADATVYFSGGLNQVYDGTARSAIATTMPAGLSVSFTYDSLAWAPTNAGTYAVTGTVVDALYAGESVTNMVVTPAAQAIAFPAIPDQYLTNLVALGASAASGLPVDFAVVEGPGAIADLTNLTFSSTGFVSVVASQAGDANREAAPAKTNRFFVHNVVIWIRGTNGVLLANAAPAAAASGTDFGGVGVARARTNWFTFGNNGTTNLVVSGALTNGTGAGAFEFLCFQDELPPGAATNFALVFRPPGLGTYTALVDIVHNGTTNAPYLINVQGEGVEPAALGTSTGRLDYVTAYGSDPPAAAFVLTNAGGAALQFTNIARQGAGAWLGVAPAAGWLAGNAGMTISGTVSVAGLDAGSYAGTVTVWSAEATNSPWDVTIGLQITQAVAAVTLSGLDQAYDGTARAVTVGTTPTGLTVVVTYNGLGWPPTNAGTYAVTAMVTEVNYAGQAVAALQVSRQAATVSLGDLLQTYDGTARNASAVTDPVGLTVALTYNGQASAPTNAGSYTVTGLVVEANYSGQTVDQLVISPAAAAVYLGSLQQVYDGTARAASATTMPAGLSVSFTYDGGAGAPVNAGSYAVTGTVANANHSGHAAGLLDVARAQQAISGFTQPDPPLSSTELGLAATTDAGLPVSFEVTAGPGMISDYTNLSFTGAGDVRVAAQQSGDTNWNAAPGVTNLVKVYEISDQNGPYAGGNQVTVNNGALGNGNDITNLWIGAQAVVAVTQAAAWVQWIMPAATVTGAVDIRIQSASLGECRLNAAYTYNPTGSIATVEPDLVSITGGITVVIGGQDLGNGGDITDVILCNVAATEIVSQDSTQVVVRTGMAPGATTGDVRVCSTSFGITIKTNAFAYYSQPTAMAIHGFALHEENGRIQVCWQTGAEQDLAGFYLYRWDPDRGVWIAVSAGPIPADGLSQGGVGASYCVEDMDAGVNTVYQYRVVALLTDGTSEPYGPYPAQAQALYVAQCVWADGTLVIRWLSRSNEWYRILHTPDLRQAFAPLAGDLPATPPLNIFHVMDPAAPRGFYRIQTE